MSNGSHVLRELNQLIEQLLEENLDGSGVERLNDILLASPAAREFYLNSILIHEALAWDAQSYLAEIGATEPGRDTGRSTEDFFTVLAELDSSPDELVIVDLTEEIERRRLAKRRANVRGNRPSDFSKSAEIRRPIVIPIWAAVGGVAAAMLLIAAFFWSDISRTLDNSEVATQSLDVPRTIVVAPVAELKDSFDAVWAGASPSAQGHLRPGEFVLSRGWVQVRTLHGVDIVLEAPVTFELGSGNAIILSHGQLVADVPEQAHSFVVETPGGHVVDSGTTFGVAVGDAGQSIAHVFKGEIVVNSGSLAVGGAVRLTENQAAILRHDGTVTSRPAAPDLFAREIPATAYQATVMKSRPMCYWRGPIDETTFLLTDHGWLGAHGQASAGVRNAFDGFTPDDPSGSLDFTGRESGAVSVPRRDAFAFEDSFTIEVWCWIDPDHGNFERIVSTRTENGGIGLGVNGPTDTAFGGWPANAPVLTFFNLKDVVATRSLPEGRWTHLVVTVDQQGRVHFFIDGVEAPTEVFPLGYEGDRAGGRDSPLMIGRNPFTGQGVQAWRGRLDEIAFYDRALTPDEINEHYTVLHGP